MFIKWKRKTGIMVPVLVEKVGGNRSMWIHLEQPVINARNVINIFGLVIPELLGTRRKNDIEMVCV